MFDYEFMTNAFAAAGIVAVVSGLVGYFLVMRGQTFAGHALSHIGFAGATGLEDPAGFCAERPDDSARTANRSISTRRELRIGRLQPEHARALCKRRSALGAVEVRAI